MSRDSFRTDAFGATLISMLAVMRITWIGKAATIKIV